MAAIDKVNVMVDDLQAGKGTAGKLLKDPELYDNANKTIANVRQLTDDINAGRSHRKWRTIRIRRPPADADDDLADLSDRCKRARVRRNAVQDPAIYNNSNQIAGGDAGTAEVDSGRSEEVSDVRVKVVLRVQSSVLGRSSLADTAIDAASTTNIAFVVRPMQARPLGGSTF